MLQLADLGVNAHGRIQDFEMGSWRLDLNFGVMSHLQALPILETKQRYPFALPILMANMYGEDGSKRRWHVGAD